MGRDESSWSDLIAALAQQLETDRLLDVSFAPIEVPVEPAVRQTEPRAPVRATAVAHSPVSSGTTRSPRDPAQSPVQRESVATKIPAPPVVPNLHRDSPKAERLRMLDETQVKNCRKCPLCEQRTRTVFGQGNVDARIAFVGEGPGYDEDQQGLAFVGKAGQLLTKMIEAMGLTRDEVYICNVVKCRPPGNRTPTAEEILACNPYLLEQLETIQPEVIVALGAPAAKTLLHTAETIGRLRGRFHEYFYSGTPGMGPSVPVMPTYHPAYLLRSPEEKGKAWQDIQAVMQHLGLPMPTRPGGGEPAAD